MKSAKRLTGGLVACLVGIFVAGWRTGGTAAGANSSEGVAAHHDKPETKIANSWDPKAAASYLDRRQSWWMDSRLTGYLEVMLTDVWVTSKNEGTSALSINNSASSTSLRLHW
jgi:hypothetical protein